MLLTVTLCSNVSGKNSVSLLTLSPAVYEVTARQGRNPTAVVLPVKVMDKCLSADGNRNANGDSFVTPRIDITVVICLCHEPHHAADFTRIQEAPGRQERQSYLFEFSMGERQCPEAFSFHFNLMWSHSRGPNGLRLQFQSTCSIWGPN